MQGVDIVGTGLSGGPSAVAAPIGLVGPFGSFLETTMAVLQGTIGAVALLLHLGLAVAVAVHLARRPSDLPTPILPGWAWVVAVFVVDVWGLLVFWLVHHSTLRPERAVGAGASTERT